MESKCNNSNLQDYTANVVTETYESNFNPGIPFECFCSEKTVLIKLCVPAEICDKNTENLRNLLNFTIDAAIANKCKSISFFEEKGAFVKKNGFLNLTSSFYFRRVIEEKFSEQYGIEVFWEDSESRRKVNTDNIKTSGVFESLPNLQLNRVGDIQQSTAESYVMEGAIKQTPYLSNQLEEFRHCSDILADIAQVNDLLIFAASLRGAAHYSYLSVRQDSFAIETINDWLIVAISDGVSQATHSHILAEFLSRKAVLIVKECLSKNDEISDDNWTNISREISEQALNFCKELASDDECIDINNVQQLAQKWAATLELIIVETNCNEKHSLVSVTIAGDGATYILGKNNKWRPVKQGKVRNGVVSNAVIALPLAPDNPKIVKTTFAKDEQVFFTTDGLSDVLGDGNNQFGKFLHEKLLICNNLISFLQLMDVSVYQADDDRTGILIKGV